MPRYSEAAKTTRYRERQALLDILGAKESIRTVAHLLTAFPEGERQEVARKIVRALHGRVGAFRATVQEQCLKYKRGESIAEHTRCLLPAQHPGRCQNPIGVEVEMHDCHGHVLAAMRTGNRTCHTLSAALGMKVATVKGYLTRMRRAGLIRSSDVRGEWKIIPRRGPANA